MASTGLSADPTEYRTRLADQSDDQIDTWAAELLRDVVIRRGIVKVVDDFRRATRLDDRGFERVFASGGGPPAVIGRDAKGRLVVPTVTLYALVPGSGRSSRTVAIDWSSTWSRTSTRSSTSEGAGAVVGGVIRLGHPFPSLLDGVVVAGIALIAGADPWAAVQLGVSMTALQVSIGTVNDIVDAPRDRDGKPGKPIPAGVVSARAALALAIASGGLGLALGWAAGPLVLLLAIVVLAVGYGYDLVFKGTAWSWLPFAIGIPLLPVYGWVGATGGVPGSFAVVIPAAVIAGAALAIANARADEDRDRAAGIESIATRLGARRSWWISAILFAIVVGVAVVTLVAGSPGPIAVVAVASAGALIAAGLAAGRSLDAGRRERAWEIQAIGVALLAAGWLAGVSLMT